MSNYDDGLLENVETILEDDESDSDFESMMSEDDESAEFLPFPFPFSNGRSRQNRVGGGQNYYRPRPNGTYVTQPQLQAALTRVREDVRRHANAINSVNHRVNTMQTTVTRQSKEISKHGKMIAAHAKQIAHTNKELKKEREKSLMLYLLSRPKSTDPTTGTANVGGVSVPTGSRVLYNTGEDNTLLLLLLMGGLGGDSSSGSSDFNPLMLLLLADKL